VEKGRLSIGGNASPTSLKLDFEPSATAAPGPASAVTRPPEPPPTTPSESLLQGTVERVTFRADETGYTVVRVSPEKGYGDPESLWSGAGERVSAVGRSPEAVEGQRVRLLGQWSEHPQHGRQFRFESWEALPPLDRDGLVRYLSSKSFHGVGPTLAERIVDALGANALSRIRDDESSLDGIRGLKPALALEIRAAVRERLGAQELFAFLYGVGLGPAQAAAVAEKLGGDAEALLRADPYRLARGIRGIGFQIADRVARQLGFGPAAPERRRAAVLHALEQAADDGHSCLPEPSLADAVGELLGEPVDLPLLSDDLALLGERKELCVETLGGEAQVYLPHLHTSESRLAANLRSLARSGPVQPLGDRAALTAAQRESGLDLHPGQAEAVSGLLAHPVALLTGGPGVGKTTTMRLVVELAEGAGLKVALASPTGRAAKRLSEACGRDASTIHRLLGFEPGGGFAHDARRPLEADLVLVDEISMLDVILAHHLVKAIAPPTRLILIGDPDQLPSVSAGNVLADLLASEVLPTFRLTQVFRQGAGSRIVTNAHRILRGDVPELGTGGDAAADFFLFRADDDESAAQRLVEVVTRRIPTRFGFDWIHDVQVLAPMYRGACGVDSLNARLRDALGAGGHEIRWRERTWRTGDRVIQTRNDYERDVFNGDMGRIVRVDADAVELVVRFPERDLVYGREELGDLQPAFAITVHRSQGGEFPAVVMPIVTQHALMLRRNLLYTAVTRAQRLLVLVGSERALELAVRQAEEGGRRSGLAERLRGASADG